MQEKYLYEYAVIRVLPKVERDEFINVGVILFSKRPKYIRMKYRLDINKFQLFHTELDWDLLSQTLRSFESICNGEDNNSSISKLEVDERFRWLTAERSTCLQTSVSQNGFSDNLDETLEQLFKELV
ncbi:MAG: DUF3037 domain-containing protein [Dysgonamonadaceae bacterium]|jgi:hypothetical protein|nr:DUF3037 domain-containing protein [Dysgonamonadaceae bacterium]